MGPAGRHGLPGGGDPIWTGLVRLVVVPSPTWPSPLSPHPQSVPSLRMPSEWLPPAAATAQVVSDPIWIGLVRSGRGAVADLPESVLIPTPEGAVGASGERVVAAGGHRGPVGRAPDLGRPCRSVVVPLPSSPSPLSPHAQRVPSVRVATVSCAAGRDGLPVGRRPDRVGGADRSSSRHRVVRDLLRAPGPQRAVTVRTATE